MSDNRPVELVRHIEVASEKNDALIVDALAKLETPEQRGKLKPTVAAICKLTGLARNTVRNRPWALERLKSIKLAAQKRTEEQLVGSTLDKKKVDIQEQLRARVRELLEQNGLLYEEILDLQRQLARKEAELKQLKFRKIERA